MYNKRGLKKIHRMRKNHLQTIYMSKWFTNHISDKTIVSRIKKKAHNTITKKYKEVNFKMCIEFGYTFLQKRYANTQKTHENIVISH